MSFDIEHKVSHYEWDEVTIPRRTFFMLYEGWFREELLNTYDYNAIFNFDNGIMNADEMWGVSNGRVWSSSGASGASGVMDWNGEEEQYVSHIFFCETKLGDFVSATFTLDEDLRAALEKLKDV